jgi:hypothetical protein
MKPTTTFIAGCALLAASLAHAQSSDTLVDKYTPLAGSKANAQQLVDGLRKGGDFTVGTTSVDNRNGKLGNGEINIALSLTQADMTKNQLGFEAALEDVLKQRASGEGWGKIANDMGVKLGDLVRSDRAKGRDDIARNDRHDARHDAHVDRPERMERPDKPERPERPDRPERANR